ncbi:MULTISPECIES: glycoside hydrolase family 2 protein [unclassified Undibacterium]|uniref:glycoside hydrolase family 2 protein n=1 Tax=unclassified Undibacterium TaxID=2630295 RepID=UPI002AC9636E|nr:MULTISPECIES: glycoside hydrolase family 2 protein [unclassified Undibacterium]MEB0138980.1 glycoside hydrolase family 2 protein [Undibacterium sp. CCC2.1]MEB0171925.1 glycoside hydrolase family 2 protein [Undibacterium sp. CCC1.1]MEB0175866.1 glycoside hydrolase family 2 protein [Undibacterium sp. CCC3.4]MEB0215068.1 glycoside hydrolase family 2 protein [Undibacterium sp. 5I2]WPX45040.1 glycoside hydrolase family 2 protein [Undibacterium sp. CCC3.4]
MLSAANRPPHWLHTGWHMSMVAADSFSLPSALMAAALPALPATLPATAASVLRAAGNEAPDTIDFDALDIWFHSRQSLPADASHLLCAGLAGVAEVFWNDTLLLRSENMFIATRHALADSTLPTQGILSLRFLALNTLLAQRRPRPRWKTRLVAQQQLRWLRTSLLGRMPGWSARGAAVGPYRGLAWELAQPYTLESRTLHSRIDGTKVCVQAAVRFSGTVAPQQVRLHVGTAVSELRLRSDEPGSYSASGSLTLPEVALWWPHTHGEAPLYPARLELIDSAGQNHVFALDALGFRQIEVKQTEDDFHVHVNGVAVFCRGVCWTPADIVSLHATPEQQTSMLLLARQAGMNMLRVVGTMLYENPAFYRLCDELGILVWQDFMFANMDYPVADADFAATVQHEAQQFLQQVQLHPCIAILCGNSEVEQQAAMLGMPAAIWRNSFFGDTLPQLCQALRPDVLYWPSSPSGGVLPFQIDAGVSHYFGVGAYLRGPDDARRSAPRFTSECLGFANIPETDLLQRYALQPDAGPDWHAGVPRDHGCDWDFDDVRDHYVEQLYRVDARALRAADTKRYLALGRSASGSMMATTLQEWRRHGSLCHGALVWFWRDLRAGAGWGVLDVDGHPKAAYYYLKRAMAPLCAFFTDEGLNGLALHVVNDGASAFLGLLELSLFGKNAQCITRGSRHISLGAHSSCQFRADALLPYFTDSACAYRFGAPAHELAYLQLSDATHTLVSACHFQAGPLPVALSQTELGLRGSWQRAEDGTLRVDLRSNLAVRTLSLSTPGYLADDNYFHLAPGQHKTLRLRAAARPSPSAGAAPQLTISALNLDGSFMLPEAL